MAQPIFPARQKSRGDIKEFGVKFLRLDKIEKAGAVWVIGVSAPAVVTGI
jgi:hypothetical protein